MGCRSLLQGIQITNLLNKELLLDCSSNLKYYLKLVKCLEIPRRNTSYGLQRAILSLAIEFSVLFERLITSKEHSLRWDSHHHIPSCCVYTFS